MLEDSNPRSAGSPRLTRFRDGRLAARPSIRCGRWWHGREESNLRQAVLETAALPQLDRVKSFGQDGWFRATDLVLPRHARYLCATSC